MLSETSMRALCGLVEACIPDGLKPSGLEATPIFDVPGWDRWGGPVGRTGRARVCELGGLLRRGPENVVRVDSCGYAALRASAAARIHAGAAPGDPDVLVQAFGDADRLMLHMASAFGVAELLDEWEIER
jgi:hypothetical protein